MPAPEAVTPGRAGERSRARRWLASRLADEDRADAGTTPAADGRAGVTSEGGSDPWSPGPLEDQERGIPPELAAEAVRRHLTVPSQTEAGAEMTEVADSLTGLGPLAELTRRPGVTDVLVDGTGSVWTDGDEGLRHTGRWLRAEHTRQLAVRLMAQGGRRLDESHPYGDVQIAGARVHAMLPPLAAGGTHLSLRLPAAEPPSLETLARHWPHGHRWAEVLRALLSRRANLLISGATGSGKTTLLTALLAEVPADERIITVEDTRELRPRHGHVVSLQSRAGNAEGAGAVDLSELVRQALRMRPDRLIVGECRGAEVADFLAAMNTGHRGAAGTLHANSAGDVPARLQAMGALAGLGAEAVTLQASSAVDAVLHVERTPEGRHPVELAVMTRQVETPGGPGLLRVVPALALSGGQLSTGPGWPRLDGTGGSVGESAGESGPAGGPGPGGRSPRPGAGRGRHALGR